MARSRVWAVSRVGMTTLTAGVTLAPRAGRRASLASAAVGDAARHSATPIVNKAPTSAVTTLMSTAEQPAIAAEPLSEADHAPRVSVVIPCLDEASNIEECVTLARQALREHELDGEVVVADNGSTDGSGRIAAAAGARVVLEPRRGYGSAYRAGFAFARGNYIVMADADLTYDFNDIPRFVEKLEDGAQLVVGDRMDNIRPGAMPWLHRYVGNPVLSGMLNFFF